MTRGSGERHGPYPKLKDDSTRRDSARVIARPDSALGTRDVLRVWVGPGSTLFTLDPTVINYQSAARLRGRVEVSLPCVTPASFTVYVDWLRTGILDGSGPDGETDSQRSAREMNLLDLPGVASEVQDATFATVADELVDRLQEGIRTEYARRS